MFDRLLVLPQYLLPKRALTAFAGVVAGARGGGATTALIRWFVGHYGVNMSEAENPDVGAYATFNEFFTRPLRAGVRPLADADFCCPVDGAISQFGAVEKDQILQAKGHSYSTSALLGGNQELADSFEDGSFATLYLSPKDYHRIHMPCDGTLQKMVYVPGALFSVNPTTARGVPGLFARNERVICLFEGPHGRFAMVLVGATIVGSMATMWHGVVNPPRLPAVQEWNYAQNPPHLKKGEEMGRFLLGSTVVMLFPKGTLRFAADWAPARGVRMGEAMGNVGG